MKTLICFATIALVACGDGGTGPAEEDLVPVFPSDVSLSEEMYTVGEPANTVLPMATGGNQPLTYALTPDLPAGLTFAAQSRTISGTPTSAQASRDYTYSATDADGDRATIVFSISVSAVSACRVGQVLSPGDSCTVGGETFEVLSDGSAMFGCCITVGQGITINNFRASRISGTNNWRIDSV